MHYLFVFVMLFLSAVTANKVVADITATDLVEQRALEIMLKANQMAYYQGRDFKASVNLQVSRIDAEAAIVKNLRSRSFIFLRRDSGDLAQKFFAFFESPADIRKTTYMAWKPADQHGYDQRWIYLSALDLVKPIAPSDKRTSFVGTSFFYEDISGRNVYADSHELQSEDEVFFIIKGVPKDKKTAEFNFWKAWINKDNYMPERIEYFKDKKSPYRIYEVQAKKVISGYPTVIKSRMIDIERSAQTVAVFSSVQYDLELPDAIFTERYLRKAPQQYLR